MVENDRSSSPAVMNCEICSHSRLLVGAGRVALHGHVALPVGGAGLDADDVVLAVGLHLGKRRRRPRPVAAARQGCPRKLRASLPSAGLRLLQSSSSRRMDTAAVVPSPRSVQARAARRIHQRLAGGADPAEQHQLAGRRPAAPGRGSAPAWSGGPCPGTPSAARPRSRGRRRALIPGHSRKAQPSGGMSLGEVISQLTVTVSPGRGLDRSGAPSTSTRAPMTRVFSTSDTGSISGAQAAASSDSATAATRHPVPEFTFVAVVSSHVGHGGLPFVGEFVGWSSSVRLSRPGRQISPRKPMLGMTGRPGMALDWVKL